MPDNHRAIMGNPPCELSLTLVVSPARPGRLPRLPASLGRRLCRGKARSKAMCARLCVTFALESAAAPLCYGPNGVIDVRQDSSHGADRLSRRRQDHAAQPHPVRAAWAEIRRHRQRIRRDRHRQRPGRRRRRGSVRDEQRLHLLHCARRPRAHHRRADAAQGQVRRHHRGDDRARRPGAGGADLLRGRECRPQDQARRGGHRGRRQVAQGSAQGCARGQEPDRLRGRDPDQQGRPREARRACRRRGAHPRHQSLCQAAHDRALPDSAAEVLGRNAFDLDRILEIEPEFLEAEHHEHDHDHHHDHDHAS